MSPEVQRSDHESRAHLSPGLLGGLELLVLGPAAGVLVLWLIPEAFDIEWACIGSTGISRTAGENYIAAFATIGTAGWLAVIAAIVFAGIAGSRRAAAVLPAVWFAVLVGAALVVAAAIGPAACPM
jgi:hypothetical protein